MTSCKVNLTSIEGNRQWLDGGAMFGNAPRPLWEKWIAPDSLGRIPLSCRSLLIQFEGIKLLLEAGIGNFFEPKLAARFGVESPEKNCLLENLQAAGHSADSIDFIILSHLHFDHAGGLLPSFAQILKGEKDLVFPKAQVVVGEQAWQRALKPHLRDRASFVQPITEFLSQSQRLVRLPIDPLPKRLEGWVEFIESEGHTPGQLHTLFKGESGKVFFCGDMIPGTHWIHLPVTMGYDRFPERLIEEKQTLYERALKEDWLLFFTHDPETAAAHLERRDDTKFVTRKNLKQLVHYSL